MEEAVAGGGVARARRLRAAALQLFGSLSLLSLPVSFFSDSFSFLRFFFLLLRFVSVLLSLFGSLSLSLISSGL